MSKIEREQQKLIKTENKRQLVELAEQFEKQLKESNYFDLRI